MTEKLDAGSETTAFGNGGAALGRIDEIAEIVRQCDIGHFASCGHGRELSRPREVNIVAPSLELAGEGHVGHHVAQCPVGVNGDLHPHSDQSVGARLARHPGSEPRTDILSHLLAENTPSWLAVMSNDNVATNAAPHQLERAEPVARPFGSVEFTKQSCFERLVS